MEFLKKHYEKIILSVVLLGLAVVAAYLPIKVNQEKESEEARQRDLIQAKVKEFPPVDLSTNQAVLVKVKTPIKFDISGRHNLFNPVQWLKKPNGELMRGDEAGLGAVKVAAINPLNLIISFDGVAGDVQNKDPKDLKYQLTVNRETMGSSGKSIRAFTIGQPINLGTLKEVKGPPDNPTAAVFQPAGENKTIEIARDKPFSQVIGYSADISYLGSLKKGMRRGDGITAGNDLYTIVNILKDTVVFQAKSNQKQTPKTVEGATMTTSTK
jgi:hypothetical protein